MSGYIRVDEVGGGQLDRVNKLLAGIADGQGAIQATYAALKRAGETAKTRAGQFAAAEYTIGKGTFMGKVKQQSKVTGSSGGAMSLSLRYAGAVIPLLEFNTKYSKSGGISTQVKRGGGGTLAHAFTARVFGPTAVYERLGKSRFPIEGKFGPSTAHMMQNDNVVERMDETIRETFDKRIDHEIMRVLNGWGG